MSLGHAEGPPVEAWDRAKRNWGEWKRDWCLLRGRLGYQLLTRESEPALPPEIIHGGTKARPDRAAEIEPSCAAAQHVVADSFPCNNGQQCIDEETNLCFHRIPSVLVGASTDASRLQEIQGKTEAVHSMRYFFICIPKLSGPLCLKS